MSAAKKFFNTILAGVLVGIIFGAQAQQRMTAKNVGPNSNEACEGAKEKLSDQAQRHGLRVSEYGRCNCIRMSSGPQSSIECRVMANVESNQQKNYVGTPRAVVRNVDSYGSTANEACSDAKSKAEVMARSRNEMVTRFSPCACDRTGANFGAMSFQCSVDVTSESR